MITKTPHRRTLAALSPWRRVGAVMVMAEGAAVLLAAWALVLGTIAGPDKIHQRYDTSIWAIMASYLLGAPVAGFIVGVLLPLTKRAGGAACVGMIAAVPMFAAVHVASAGFSTLSGGDLFDLVAASVLVGGGGGAYIRYRINRDDQAKKAAHGS